MKQRMMVVVKYGLLLAGMLLFLLLGWQQNETPQEAQQNVTLIRQTKRSHVAKLTNYSPDKTYRNGELVVKDGIVYRVRVNS